MKTHTYTDRPTIILLYDNLEALISYCYWKTLILLLIAYSLVMMSSRRYFSQALVAFGMSKQYYSQSAVCQATSTPVADLRKEYSNMGLHEGSLPLDPIELFTQWMDEAKQANVLEPNAMCLSTCASDVPTARVVLLKRFDTRGFVWYTNYGSRKANDLERNPKAAITFWWGDLERQVRIEGVVEKVSAEESDEYFHSRPVGSQIGAWSSTQSQKIASRDELDRQEQQAKTKLSAYTATDQLIPRPLNWGGYRLVPHRIEFWKGRKSRMHDRIVYEKKPTQGNLSAAEWSIFRLQP
mmetsp:Transcript_3468/g.5408  ORF Transcript_3468/g.5408 Transcript_3468/m.5408 type:complete len:296 (+) Transcript_3468:28-915(+)